MAAPMQREQTESYNPFAEPSWREAMPTEGTPPATATPPPPATAMPATSSASTIPPPSIHMAPGSSSPPPPPMPPAAAFVSQPSLADQQQQQQQQPESASSSAAARPQVSAFRIGKAGAHKRKTTSAPMAFDLTGEDDDQPDRRPLYQMETAASAASYRAAAASTSAVAASPVAAAPAASSSAPPVVSPPPSSAAYCVLISNIPPSVHSVDLRFFFADMVEGGRFKVFQPRRRVDERNALTATSSGTSLADVYSTLPPANLPRQLFSTPNYWRVAKILFDLGPQPVVLPHLEKEYRRRHGLRQDPQDNDGSAVGGGFRSNQGGLRSFVNLNPLVFALENILVDGRMKSAARLTQEGTVAVCAALASSSGPASAAAAPAPTPDPTASKRRYEAIAESAIAPEADRKAVHRHSSIWQVLVQVHTQADVDRLLSAEYNGREWTDWQGARVPGGARCQVRFISLPRHVAAAGGRGGTAGSAGGVTRPAKRIRTPKTVDLTQRQEVDLTMEDDAGPVDEERKQPPSPPPTIAAAEDDLIGTDASESAAEAAILAAISAGEFETPPYLPQGMVGTPSELVQANITHLPLAVLKKLKIRPIVQTIQAKRFKYGYTMGQGENEGNQQQPQHPSRRQRSLSPERRYLQRNTDDVREEWDRELDTGDRSMAHDEGRGLEKIGDGISYEDDTEKPWDKGDGSGLVTYTDAVYHAAHKGDMDEQTTDAWNVEEAVEEADRETISEEDASGWDDGGEEPPRAISRERRSAIMSARLASADRAMETARTDARVRAQQAREHAETSWTRSSFLSNLMGKMGYRPGQGLGKMNQGRATPIETPVRGEKEGLGFTRKGGAAGDGGGGRSGRTSKNNKRKARNNRGPPPPPPAGAHPASASASATDLDSGSAQAFYAAVAARARSATWKAVLPTSQWTPRSHGSSGGATAVAAAARADFAGHDDVPVGSGGPPAYDPSLVQTWDQRQMGSFTLRPSHAFNVNAHVNTDQH